MKLGNYPYKSDLRLEFEAILDHHGVALTEEERRLISSCEDLQRLDTWFDLALAGASADELFACEALATAEPALR